MNASVLLEVATDSPLGARAAEAAGASRIELCAGLCAGGLTPSLGTIERTLAATRLPVMVLLRPRAGDFLYDDEEFAVLRRDLAVAKSLGAAGVVVGLLDAEGQVDVERVRELVALARPLQVTFHRAFDLARDPPAALEELARLRVDRILTSGGAATAWQGADKLREWIERAHGRLTILPGGGIRPENALALVRATGARELHFSARRAAPSPMRFRRAGVRMGAAQVPGEYERHEPDSERVRAMARLFGAAGEPRT